MHNTMGLYDGISCGRLALDRAGIPHTYHASEIDRHAVAVAQSNWPDTVQHGDVTRLRAKDLPRIDLLMGGSPCQGFSSIGGGRGLDDPRSALFWHFVRLLEECQPRWFLLENVRMRRDWLDVITAALGVQPILIDSALLSAQHRERWYWTNIPNVTQPTDLGITLDDIIEPDPAEVSLPNSWRHRVPDHMPMYVDPYNGNAIVNGKATTLRTNCYNGNMWVRYGDRYRQLTVTECERLQTVPEGYTSAVSHAEARRLLANGWTVDVIAHLLRGLTT